MVVKWYWSEVAVAIDSDDGEEEAKGVEWGMMRLKDQEQWVLAFAHILDVCHIPPDLQDGLNYRLWRYGVLSKIK